LVIRECQWHKRDAKSAGQAASRRVGFLNETAKDEMKTMCSTFLDATLRKQGSAFKNALRILVPRR
jgi:hypothetical protein